MCNFPAKALLLDKRRICAEADQSDDPQQIQYAAQYARDIDNLRIAHETLTGCRCWFQAVKEANSDAH